MKTEIETKISTEFPKSRNKGKRENERALEIENATEDQILPKNE